MPLRSAPTLLDGLTLQVDLCLERGDRAGAAMFIDLIYDLHDWTDGVGDMAVHIADGVGEVDVVATYEVRDGKIARAWFKQGVPRRLERDPFRLNQRTRSIVLFSRSSLSDQIGKPIG